MTLATDSRWECKDVPKPVLLDDDFWQYLGARGLAVRFSEADEYPVVVRSGHVIQPLHTLAWRFARRTSTGELVTIPAGAVIHHKHGRGDNRGRSLELKTRSQHARQHAMDKEEDRSGLPPPGPVKQVFKSLDRVPPKAAKAPLLVEQLVLAEKVLAPYLPGLLDLLAKEEITANKIPRYKGDLRLHPTRGEAALALLLALYHRDFERIPRELALSSVEARALKKFWAVRRLVVEVTFERWRDHRRLPHSALRGTRQSRTIVRS